MGYVVITEVTCDRCYRPSSEHAAIAVHSDKARKREARKAARERGWKLSRQEDVCPECLEDDEHE